jgi:general secretion pathway protein D
MTMTDRRRAPVALLCAVALLSACAERQGQTRDVFSGLRADAAAPRGPLRADAEAGAEAVGGGSERQQVRGFVRRRVETDRALGVGGAGAELGEPAEFSVNFEAAPIADVVRAMIEDGLGASYVLDPAVTGAVTIRTNRPLTRSQILPTLEEILRLNDAAVIERNGVLQVLPRDAAGLAAPVMDARSLAARGLTTRRHAPAPRGRGGRARRARGLRACGGLAGFRRSPQPDLLDRDRGRAADHRRSGRDARR